MIKIVVDIPSYETFSSLILYKYLRFPPLSIRPLGLLAQAFELDILITFVNTFCLNYLCK